jgi:GTPase SAR1 family protein
LPTIGIDMQTMKIKFNNMTVKVNIWDPAGQDRFEALTKNYIQNIDAILLVFDMTDKGSLDSVLKWYD